MSTVDLRKIIKESKSGWVALTGDNKKEIAKGKTLHEVLPKAREKGESNPSVFKVPNTVSHTGCLMLDSVVPDAKNL